MINKNREKKKVRITLDLSAPFYSRLEELQREADLDTKASVIREALRLYEYVVKRTRKGWKFRAIDRQGKEENPVFLWPAGPGD